MILVGHSIFVLLNYFIFSYPFVFVFFYFVSILAPKVDKSGRPYVGENSRDLLQSRIAQLNNNFEYNRPMVPKRFLSTTMTTTTANSGKNNDYVNMLSNEVCQKLNSATSANSNVLQQSNIIETTTGQTSSRPFGDATDSVKISSAFRDPSTATANIRKMPGSDLLKPIGDCRRCSKTLIANDRVTILGRNFHRYLFIHSSIYQASILFSSF